MQVLSGTTWDGPGGDMTALLHWHVASPADAATADARLTVCTASLRPVLVRPSHPTESRPHRLGPSRSHRLGPSRSHNVLLRSLSSQPDACTPERYKRNRVLR